MFHFPGKKFLVAVIIITGIPLISFLLWYFKTRIPVEILVMNKSAASVSRIEHKAAFWIFNNSRIVKRTGKSYNHKEDYYGFIPVTPYRNKEYLLKEIRTGDIDSLSDHYDMAWFVDSYGLTYDDWYGNPSHPGRSRILYGGLTQADYMFIRDMIRKKKPVIAEFNFFASPTSQQVRSKSEELTGIYWSGWTGFYCDNLDRISNGDLPLWIINTYQEQNGIEWNYSNPGIVLVSQHNRIVVLEKETHIDIEFPLIITGSDKAARYGIARLVHFPGRFDISYATDPGKVISYFELSVNANGESLLKDHNLPFRFPAVVGNPGSIDFYYLAGNFSEARIGMTGSKFWGIRFLKSFLDNDGTDSRSEFYRSYYYPFISTVISDYHEFH